MADFKDQTGRIVSIPFTPRRIVSLVPSQTELLATLGLHQEVVGITKFCIHPADWFRDKPRVGGTKQLKLDIIEDLQPDLIIANKEENVKEQVLALTEKFPVWISDVNNLTDALEMIRDIGLMTGKENTAGGLIEIISTQFATLTSIASPPQTAYLIWNDPYMTVGRDTFIHDILTRAGFRNMFADQLRYPEIRVEQLQECEVLLLSSEPFPFREKHLHELQDALPKTKIMLVDGEMFSWYGSRLRAAPAYFQQLREQLAF